MTKKLTITVEDAVYGGLHAVIGRGRISGFLNDLVKARGIGIDLASSYAAMAADEDREREAQEWVEGLIGVVAA